MTETPAPPRPRWPAPLFILLGVAALAALALPYVLPEDRTVPPEDGTASVMLDDPGPEAVVRLDGEEIAPEALREPRRLRAGEHTLSVSGPYLDPAELRFTVLPGKDEPVPVPLTRYGEVRLDLGELGPAAEARLDDEPADAATLAAPLRLPVGEHTLAVTGRHLAPFAERFTVRPGDNPAWAPPLGRRGRLKVVTNDSLAEVRLRGPGVERALTGDKWDAVPPGEYTLTASGPYCEPVEQRVAVKFAEEVTVPAQVWPKVGLLREQTDAGPRALLVGGSLRRVVTYSVKGAELRDLAAGQLLRRFADDGGDGLRDLAATPDGRRLLGAVQKELRLWDAESGEVLWKSLPLHGKLRFMALSPDGDRALTADLIGAVIRLWDVRTGKQLATWPGRPANATVRLDFAADGRFAFVEITQALAPAAKPKPARLEGFLTQEKPAAPAPAPPVHEFLVLKLPELTEVHHFPDPGGAKAAFALSRGGDTLFGRGADGKFATWDVMTGKLLHTLDNPADWVLCAAFSPDGQRILVGGKDGKLLMWEHATGKVTAFNGHTGYVVQVAFSPDGRRILSGGAGGLFPGRITLDKLPAKDSSLRLWDVSSGKELWHGNEGRRTTPGYLSFSLCGHYALVGAAELPALRPGGGAQATIPVVSLWGLPK